MAVYKATKNGNWNDATVWDLGTIPGMADDVYANSFTVTLTQNIIIASLRNTSAPGITVGGRFNNNNNYSITGDVYASTVACVQTSTTVNGGTYNFSGNYYGGSTNSAFAISLANLVNVNIVVNGNSYGGNAQNTTGIGFSGTNCTINYTGTLTSGTGIQSPGLILTGGGWTGTVTATMSGGTGGSAIVANTAAAFSLNASGSNITVIGNCTAGGGGNFGAILNTLANGSTLTITGTATGGGIAGAFGAYNNNATGILRVYSAVGSGVAEGVGSVSGAITTVERITYNANGSSGVGANVKMKRTVNNQITIYDESGNPFVLSDTTNLSNQFPAAGNVRQGVSYAAGNLAGTLAVPAPANVRRGIATDNTVGLADLTREDFWNAPLDSLTGGIGARLKDVSTVQSTGDQLAAAL